MRFFYGMIFVATAIAIIKYAYPIGRFTGSLDWAERVFGAGWTYLAIKLIGVIIIIVSIMYMAGTFSFNITSPATLRSNTEQGE